MLELKQIFFQCAFGHYNCNFLNKGRFMSNLTDIQKQITELQAQVQAIKTSEFNEKLAMIKEIMTTYGITIEHLQNQFDKAGKTKSKTPAPAKFTGPNGESWTGRGLMPRWLKALVDEGHAKEEYLINK
jgi:DNA-binding protein H-NS